MSDIKLTCSCGATLKVINPALRGKAVKCPRCSAPVAVPADRLTPARERVAPAPAPAPTAGPPSAASLVESLSGSNPTYSARRCDLGPDALPAGSATIG